MPFADRLRALRHAAGLTAQQLADAAGTTRTYIHELEQGRRTNPSWGLVCALARALQCCPGDFVEEHNPCQ